MQDSLMPQSQELKDSPLGWIPSEWEVRQISDLAAQQDYAIVDGPFGSNLKVSDYVDHGVPVLQGSYITGDSFNLQDIRFVSASKAQELRRSLARVGDLLVVKIGSVGYSAIIDDLGPFDVALIPANLLKATFDANQVSVKYVHHFLTSDIGRRRLIDVASQTAQPALTLSRFKRLVIPLPSPPEQRCIAEMLDTVDAAIQQTEALIAKLKLMKAGLLHDLLTHGLDEHGQLRDPSAHPEQFKDSPLGRIPKEWEATTIGELGVWRGGSTPSKAVASNWSGGTILWVSPKDIRGAEISDSEDKITERALAQSTLSLFSAGDVLVVFRSGILRHTFPVAVGLVPFTVNQDIKVLAVRPGIYRRFAFYALQAMGSKVLSLAVKAGTTVESIDYRVFSMLPLILPPEREQQQIVSRLDAHDARLRAEEASCDKLKQLKKGLMRDLLTGRVRVQAAEAAR